MSEQGPKQQSQDIMSPTTELRTILSHPCGAVALQIAGKVQTEHPAQEHSECKPRPLSGTWNR
jgi:hypothetical protein